MDLAPCCTQAFPGGSSGKEPTASAGDKGTDGFDPCNRRVLYRRAWQSTPFCGGRVWRTPWSEESGGLQSLGLHTVRRD